MKCVTFEEAKKQPEGTFLASIRRVEPAVSPKEVDATSIELLTPWRRNDPSLDGGENNICVGTYDNGETPVFIRKEFGPFIAIVTVEEVVVWCRTLALERRSGNMVINDIEFPDILDVPSYSI